MERQALLYNALGRRYHFGHLHKGEYPLLRPDPTASDYSYYRPALFRRGLKGKGHLFPRHTAHETEVQNDELHLVAHNGALPGENGVGETRPALVLR